LLDGDTGIGRRRLPLTPPATERRVQRRRPPSGLRAALKPAPRHRTDPASSTSGSTRRARFGGLRRVVGFCRSDAVSVPGVHPAARAAYELARADQAGPSTSNATHVPIDDSSHRLPRVPGRPQRAMERTRELAMTSTVARPHPDHRGHPHGACHRAMIRGSCRSTRLRRPELDDLDPSTGRFPAPSRPRRPSTTPSARPTPLCRRCCVGEHGTPRERSAIRPALRANDQPRRGPGPAHRRRYGSPRRRARRSITPADLPVL